MHPSSLLQCAAARRFRMPLTSMQDNAVEPGGTGKEKSVVVIGAGWGGLATAWALSKREGYRVTLVDAQATTPVLLCIIVLPILSDPRERTVEDFWCRVYRPSHTATSQLFTVPKPGP